MKTKAKINHCFVFVYGTLQKGQVNEPVVSPYVQRRWRGRIKGRLYHLADRGYPEVLLEEDGVVLGECLQLKQPEKALQALDALEEHFGEDDVRNEYDRRRCLVCSDDGQEWECYSDIVANNNLDYTNRIGFHEKWHPFIRLGNHMHIMTCHCLSGVKYAPLYIHSFQLLQPRNLLEAERFNIKYISPSEIATVPDKLRYYRHKNGLQQKEVAEKTGIHRATYCAYEQEERKMPYPLDKLSKIAELFGVEITALLDEYNLFLYNGQGRQIRDLRQSLGLTKKEFGELYGFHAYTVNKWENDTIQILKSTWVNLFANK